MRCLKCGAFLPDDSVFCQFCGEKVEVATDDNEVTSPEQGLVEVEAPWAPEAVEPDVSETQIENVGDDADTAPSDEPEPDIAPECADDLLERKASFEEQELTAPKEDASGAASDDDLLPSRPQIVKGQRYCKKCGGLIDRETKKCQGCGKQYLHITKIVWIAFLAIICCALLGLSVYQHGQIVSMERELEEATATISEKEKIVASQRKKISEQESKIDAQKGIANLYEKWWADKAHFMDDHIVLIGDSNNKYHKYGCEDLDLTYFYAYNTENAKAQGYRACSKCN